MGKKDIISKDVITKLIKDIAKYILNIEVNNLTLIDKELQRVEDRKADVIANVDNKYILHIEIQNQNDKTMPLRMMRYFTDIAFISDLPIKQYMIYIGKEKLNMSNIIKGIDFEYKYNIIDMKTIDCEKFIKLDTPDSLVLAILCDFKDKNPQDIVNYIIKRLYEHSKNNEKMFREYMLMLEELSKNRNLEKAVQKGEDMLTEINYETLPSFYLGFEKGEEKGIEKGIEKGVKAIYVFEKNPKKIAQMMEIDENMVYNILNKIQGENNANVR